LKLLLNLGPQTLTCREITLRLRPVTVTDTSIEVERPTQKKPPESSWRI
jgi:hypothetical protein